jgi:hypothetical protein
MRVVGIDHVQLAIPPEAESIARAFYGGLLELSEIPKPAQIALRGGVWFQCGSLQIHLGIDRNSNPAKKAHPALLIEGYEKLLKKLADAGCEVRKDTSIPDVTRCFTSDPFGNRIELISADTGF